MRSTGSGRAPMAAACSTAPFAIIWRPRQRCANFTAHRRDRVLDRLHGESRHDLDARRQGRIRHPRCRQPCLDLRRLCSRQCRDRPLPPTTRSRTSTSGWVACPRSLPSWWCWRGVYSMLGDVAPLKEMVAVAKRHGAMVLSDEAHSMGFYGPNGRGVYEDQGLEDQVDFVVGTFFQVGRHGRRVSACRTIRSSRRSASRAAPTSLPPRCRHPWSRRQQCRSAS